MTFPVTCDVETTAVLDTHDAQVDQLNRCHTLSHFRNSHQGNSQMADGDGERPKAHDKAMNGQADMPERGLDESRDKQLNDGTDASSDDQPDDLIFAVDQHPPWHLCLLLGFQQYLTSFGSTLTIPLILSVPLCMGRDVVGLSQLIATFYFASGIATLLQTTIGIRLPIIQGATVSFLLPALTILNLPEWKCPANTTVQTSDVNASLDSGWGVEDDRQEWQLRMREIQGAVAVACVFQMLLGLTGVMNLVLRFVGPLTVAPAVTLIGISLFRVVAVTASTHWWIALLTAVLITVFSQYLDWVKVTLASKNKTGEQERITLPIFKLFPILFGILISWFVCLILTLSGALPDDPNEWGYAARTDIKTRAIVDSPWIRVPYPGQWGMPTVSAGAALGMFCGVLTSVIESIGDYYACARFSGAPVPPSTAINRGIAIEGLGGLLAGLLGTGNATTSYSDNIASISITRVSSLRVFQVAGLILVFMGCIGKFGAVFVMLPDPVAGGLYLVTYGMIAAVGLANLQFVDLRAPRNLFVIGVSFFVGLSVPVWMADHEHSLQTGVESLDKFFQVLLSTSMFVGGFVGFLLDNTIPGTLEQRGILAWRSTQSTASTEGQRSLRSTYQLPFLGQWLRNRKWVQYVPFCTTYEVVEEELEERNSLYV